MDKKIVVFICLFLQSPIFAFIAENRSTDSVFLDNPASLNILNRVELLQSISFNGMNGSALYYRQQVVLPKILCFKSALSFDGLYANGNLRFKGVTGYGSIGIKDIFSLGFSGGPDGNNAGMLLNLKFFSAGVVFEGLTLEQPYYKDYHYGISLFFDISRAFQLKFYLDRLGTAVDSDMGRLGILETVGLRGVNLTFQENLLFDKSTLAYDFSFWVGLKQINICWDYGMIDSGYKNRVSVKFLFDPSLNEVEKELPDGYFLFISFNDREKTTFEIVVPDCSARYWILNIYDSHKNLVKSISGSGKCPSLVSWNHTDEYGKQVADGNYVGRAVFVQKDRTVVKFDDRPFEVNQ